MELYVFFQPDHPKLLNYSPFCAKSQAFFKLAKVEHSVKDFFGNPAKLPKGKLPFLVDENRSISDSHFIQNYIERKLQLDFDKDLSKEQRALGFSMTKMIEEFLYWGVLYERWILEENFQNLKNVYFSSLPKFFRPLVGRYIQRNLKKSHPRSWYGKTFPGRDFPANGRMPRKFIHLYRIKVLPPGR